MTRGPTWFNITSLVVGFSFLYLPIVLLVIYSFNESRLVTVWGGFFHQMVCLATPERSVARCCLGHAARRVHIGDHRDRARNAGSACAGPLRPVHRTLAVFRMIFAPLVMPEVILGLSLLLLFVAMDTARGFWTVMLAHTTFAMCYVAGGLFSPVWSASTSPSKRRPKISVVRRLRRSS